MSSSSSSHTLQLQNINTTKIGKIFEDLKVCCAKYFEKRERGKD
jgi:hypothetical protein